MLVIQREWKILENYSVKSFSIEFDYQHSISRNFLLKIVRANFKIFHTVKVLAILGSGHQALAHMQVLLNQHPTITDIKVWNHRKSGAIKMAEEASGWLKEGQKIEVFENVKNCVTEADLVVTATFAPRPVLKSGLKSMYIVVVEISEFFT